MNPDKGVRARLVKLLEHHERVAAALRLSLGLLDDDGVTSKRKTGARVLATAITLDAARRNGARPKSKPRRSPTERRAAGAEKMREILAYFDPVVPRDKSVIPDPRQRRLIGASVRHGLLIKTARGYRLPKPRRVGVQRETV